MIDNLLNKKKPITDFINPEKQFCKQLMVNAFMEDNTNSYLWLLKPTALNRGRGIHLFSSLDQLIDILYNYIDKAMHC